MKVKASRIAWDTLLIALGSLIYAAGFQFFMYPNDIATGGVTGIAMILNYRTGLPVGLLSIAMNIPLFFISWRKFGLRFMLLSLEGMALSSVAVDVLAAIPLEITHEPLLGAVYGGAVHGLGMGLVYLTGATTGGVDIPAKFLRQRYQHINFGTLLLALDVMVILAFALIFRLYTSAMYAVICMFISTKVIDLVLYGAVNSKVCYIITARHEPITQAIMDTLGRGVTYLHGAGAYSHAEREIVLCVIKQRQIVELKRLVKELDEDAFVIVSDSREVFGQGFASIGETR